MSDQIKVGDVVRLREDSELLMKCFGRGTFLVTKLRPLERSNPDPGWRIIDTDKGLSFYVNTLRVDKFLTAARKVKQDAKPGI